jgi:hypothetical protein
MPGIRLVNGEAEIAIVGCVFTVTVTLTQAVVLQLPSALTKKVVVALTATLLSVAPVPTKVPPQLPLYQFHEAPVPKEPPVILRLTEVVAPHVDVILELADVAATDNVLTVKVAADDVAAPQLPVTTTS